MIEFPAAFSLLRAPACVGAARHSWGRSIAQVGFIVDHPGSSAFTRTCARCGAVQMEIWGGKSPRRSAGGCLRVRYSNPLS